MARQSLSIISWDHQRLHQGEYDGELGHSEEPFAGVRYVSFTAGVLIARINRIGYLRDVEGGLSQGLYASRHLWAA